MPKIKLNEKGFAPTSGHITVYNYSKLTNEFLFESLEYLPVGVGIPAYSTTQAPPPAKEGYAIVRNEKLGKWEYIEDYRGQTMYEISSKRTEVVNTLGLLPAGFTLKVPATNHDDWDGTKWVTDEKKVTLAKQQTVIMAKKNKYLDGLEKISVWQTKLQLGILPEADKAKLLLWLDYLDKVEAIDPSTPESAVVWPDIPETD